MSRQVGIWAGRPARVARDAVEDAPNNHAVEDALNDHASTNGGHEGGAGARAIEGLVQQVSI